MCEGSFNLDYLEHFRQKAIADLHSYQKYPYSNSFRRFIRMMKHSPKDCWATCEWFSEEEKKNEKKRGTWYIPPHQNSDTHSFGIFHLNGKGAHIHTYYM